MKTRFLLRFFLIAFVILCFTGCASFKPVHDTSREREEPLLSMASSSHDLKQSNVAAVRARVALEDHKRQLASDPANYKALIRAADYSILFGTAHTDGFFAKRRLFKNARLYAECAMKTNADFATAIGQGAPTWESAELLTENEMEAMLLWMTAIMYSFKEGMIPPERIINLKWIARMKPFVQQMDRIDPYWQGGVVPLYRGFYDFIMPPSLGGDRENARKFFEQAVAASDNRFLTRWARAKFFHVATENKTAFRDDMEWIVEQDPGRIVDPPHWKNYIQQDARTALVEINRYF